MPVKRMSPEAIGITKDLMQKVANDVSRALDRTLSIAPQPHLPVAMCAGSPIIAAMALMLDSDPKPSPDPDCLLLAGLMLARMGIKSADPVSEAYKDFDLLKSAGRTTAL